MYYRLYDQNSGRVAVRGHSNRRDKYTGRLDLYRYIPAERTAGWIRTHIMDLESFGRTGNVVLYGKDQQSLDDNFCQWVPGMSLDVMIHRPETRKPSHTTSICMPQRDTHATSTLHYQLFEKNRKPVPAKTRFVPGLLNLGRVDLVPLRCTANIKQRIAEAECFDDDVTFDLYTHTGDCERIKDECKEWALDVPIDVVFSKVESKPLGWFAWARQKIAWKAKRGVLRVFLDLVSKFVPL